MFDINSDAGDPDTPAGVPAKVMPDDSWRTPEQASSGTQPGEFQQARDCFRRAAGLQTWVDANQAANNARLAATNGKPSIISMKQSLNDVFKPWVAHMLLDHPFELLYGSSLQTQQQIMAYLANFEDSTMIRQEEMLRFVLRKHFAAAAGSALAQVAAAASHQNCAIDPDGNVLFDPKGDFISNEQLGYILLRPDDLLFGFFRYQDGTTLDKRLIARMKATSRHEVASSGGSGDEEEDDGVLQSPGRSSRAAPAALASGDNSPLRETITGQPLPRDAILPQAGRWPEQAVFPVGDGDPPQE